MAAKSRGKPVRRHIDEIGRFLFEPLIAPKKKPRSRSWELLSWDVEQGLCLIMKSRDHLLMIELEDRDEERDAYARTERFNFCVRRHFEAGSPLSESDRKLVDAIVRMVAQREQFLPEFERPTTSRSAALREVLVDRLLIPEGAGHYYINPYVGCMIGCEFCYVAPRADMSRRLEGLPELPWGRYVDVKVNAAEVLREELKRYPPGLIRMSPILTDPYQGPERRYRITRQCLEVIREDGRFIPGILTRAARVLDDLDLLAEMRHAVVGFSIPSDDDRYRRMFEPGADPVEERIGALKALKEAGIHTTAVIQPVLPMDPERLVDLVAPLIRHVRVDRMHHLDRYAHMYEAHDLQTACSDEWFAHMVARLETLFAGRGVGIDEMDNLIRLLGLEVRGEGIAS